MCREIGHHHGDCILDAKNLPQSSWSACKRDMHMTLLQDSPGKLQPNLPALNWTCDWRKPVTSLLTNSSDELGLWSLRVHAVCVYAAEVLSLVQLLQIKDLAQGCRGLKRMSLLHRSWQKTVKMAASPSFFLNSLESWGCRTTNQPLI